MTTSPADPVVLATIAAGNMLARGRRPNLDTRYRIWEFPDGDPWPNITSISAASSDGSFTWASIVSCPPQIERWSGRWFRRLCYKIFTLYGFLAYGYGVMLQGMVGLMIYILGPIWSQFFLTRLQGYFGDGSTNLPDGWEDLAFAVASTAIVFSVPGFLYSFDVLYHRYCVYEHRVFYRTGFRDLAEQAKLHNAYIQDYDLEYDSDTDPLEAWKYFAEQRLLKDMRYYRRTNKKWRALDDRRAQIRKQQEILDAPAAVQPRAAVATQDPESKAGVSAAKELPPQDLEEVKKAAAAARARADKDLPVLVTESEKMKTYRERVREVYFGLELDKKRGARGMVHLGSFPHNSYIAPSGGLQAGVSSIPSLFQRRKKN